jgi:hypothetical protein
MVATKQLPQWKLHPLKVDAQIQEEGTRIHKGHA